MSTKADRLAEQISDYFHKCDTLQPLGWHMARGLSSALAASLAQQQATQEAQPQAKCPHSGQCHPGFCDYPKCTTLATQPPSPCTAKELSEAELRELILQTVYEGDGTIPYRDQWSQDIGIPFARAIERAHGIPGSRQQATPTPPQEPSQPEAGEG